MKKAVIIVALTCFLIAGAAATSILARDSVPSAPADMASVVGSPVVSNRESKQDKLTVVASIAPVSSGPQTTTDFSAPLRQAFASSSAAEVEAAKAVAALPEVETPKIMAAAPPQADAPAAVPQPKPKAASRPQPQKSYALLSDGQIAGIKERLRLSSSQEYYWPAVETALRAVARKINAAREHNPNAAAAQLDPDSAEVQELKSAAMPLLFQLRDDQKEEVRKLARIIGLDKVASAI